MSNTLTNLIFHIVFSTKNRAHLITKEFEIKLYTYTRGIIHRQGGILLEAGGMSDHVHLLIKLPANQSISDLVRLIKTNSSKWANSEDQVKSFFAWQSGYGAFTVSASAIEKIKKIYSKTRAAPPDQVVSR